MPATAIIPAYRAAATVAATVRAARSLPGVSETLVVDDGSDDGTGEVAREAGPDTVIVLPSNRGKGAALAAGVQAANNHTVLFLDADLGPSAAAAQPLLDAISDGAGMSIAVLPARPRSGGLGLALGLARLTIRLLSGLELTAPMSGQRALTKHLVQHTGIAPRFGAEVGLTVEIAHLGAAIREVPLPFEHAHTGRTLPGFLHRGRQFKDILRFLLLAGYGLGWPALPQAAMLARLALLLLALAALPAAGALPSPPASSAIGLAVVAALLLWLPLLWLTSVSLRLRKPNYLGRNLPAAAGLLFPLVGLLGLWLAPIGHPLRSPGLLIVGVFGLLGLLDDLFGRRYQARGLRGHLLALLRGRLTTGALKALGGLAAGLAAGALLHPGRPALIAADALLVALTANLVNLLDLRPGRALKGFGLLCLLPAVLSPDSLHLLGPLLAAAAVSAPADLAGRTMMGDVGANTLGAAAGLALAASLGPAGRIAAIILLLALHLLCERLSLTDLIARSRLLSSLDRLGAAHLPPLPAAHEAAPR